MARMFAVLAVFALALSLAFSASVTTTGSALAQGSGSGAGGTKTCRAKTADGKTKTWRCQKNQACCVNQMMGTYVCGIPGMGCL